MSNHGVQVILRRVGCSLSATFLITNNATGFLLIFVHFMFGILGNGFNNQQTKHIHIQIKGSLQFQ